MDFDDFQNRDHPRAIWGLRDFRVVLREKKYFFRGYAKKLFVRSTTVVYAKYFFRVAPKKQSIFIAKMKNRSCDIAA